MADAGVEVGHGYIAISASARDAVRQVEREFGGAMPNVGKKAGKGMSGGFLAAAGKIAGPLAALFAVDKIAGFFTEANAEARESQKVGKTTAQIIKATGGAAKITASQVGDLATAISNKTGVDDEAVQKGANLLLTFKQVRNEAGKGSDVFDRATRAAVDLSAAGFGSIESSSKVLGKALSDPTKGMTALSRAGVTFTGEQQKQIKAMQKSGDLLGAQKIIMKEVESQVGGVAAASATAGEKMSVAWGNFKEQIGTAVLPLLDKVEGFVTTKMIPALSTAVTWVSANAGPAFARLRAILAPVVDFLGRLFSQITAGGGPAAGFLQTKLVPAFMGIATAGQRLGVVVLPIIRQIAGAFLQEWPRIQPIISGIFTTISGIVVDVMGLIRNRIATVTKVIQFIWSRWGNQITTIVVSLFKTVYSVIAGTLKVVGGIVKVVTGLMTGDWRKAGEGIKQIVSGIRQALVAIFKNIQTQVQTLVGGLLTALIGRWTGFLSWTAGKLRSGLSKIRDFILDPIRSARDALRGVLGAISGKFSSAVTAIGRAWDGLKEKAKAPVRFVVNTVLENGILAAFRKIAGLVGMNTGNFHVSLPRGFHSGGYTGPGPKLMPAGIVHADEFVISKSARRSIEAQQPGLLDYMNRTGSPGYAQGGLVGGSGRFTDKFASVLLAAQRILKLHFSIFQRGFRPATSYSGTSHAGDAVDLAPVTARVVAVLRKLGVAAWRRGPKQGFTPHIHGVPLPGYGSAGGSGAWQAQDYLRGGDGLGGRDYEARGGTLAKIGAFLKAGFDSFKEWFSSLIKAPLAKLTGAGGGVVGDMAAAIARQLVGGLKAKVAAFDSGGYLQPGLTMAYNGTGQPERVRTAAQEAGRGPLVQQVFPASMDPMTAAAVAGSRVVTSLRARGV
jgi:phage-related protein